MIKKRGQGQNVGTLSKHRYVRKILLRAELGTTYPKLEVVKYTTEYQD